MGLPMIGMAILGVVSVAASYFLRPSTKLPDTSSQGTRLSELTATSSEYAIGIPRVWGTHSVPGNIIWVGTVHEHAHVTTTTSRGGKGGGGESTHTQTEYTYNVSLAVGLCEGKIDRVLRILMDGSVVYDATGASLDLAVPGMLFTLHHGTEHQDKDPIIVSQMGDSDTPAYRGLAYVVFDELEITSFGNRIPQLQFVVQRDGTPRTLTQPTQIPSDAGLPIGNDFSAGTMHFTTPRYTWPDPTNTFRVTGKRLNTGIDFAQRALTEPGGMGAAVIAANRKYIVTAQGYAYEVPGAPDGANTAISVLDAQTLAVLHMAGDASGPQASNDALRALSGTQVASYYSAAHKRQRCIICTPYQQRILSDIEYWDGWWNAQWPALMSNFADVSDPQGIFVPDWTVMGMPSFFTEPEEYPERIEFFWLRAQFEPYELEGQVAELCRVVIKDEPLSTDYPFMYTTAEDFPFAHVTVIREIRATDIDPHGRLSWLYNVTDWEYPPGGGFYRYPDWVSCIDSIVRDPQDGSVIITAVKGIFTVKMSSSGQVLWRNYSLDYDYSPPLYDLTDRFIYVGRHRLDNRTLAVYAERDGVQGAQLLDLTRGKEIDFYPCEWDSFWAWDSKAKALLTRNHVYYLDRGSINSVSVAQIVAEVSAQVGVDPGDLSDLDGLEVTGYLQAGPSEARGILDPLGSLYSFDAFDAGGHLRWARRGKPAAVSIRPDQALQGRNSVSSKRADDVSLPQAVALSYSDPEIGFESSTVYRQRYAGNEGYKTNRSHNQHTLEVAAAIPGHVAKQAADTILMQAWYGRTSYKITVPRNFLLLDAGDVLTLEEPGQLPVDVLIETATVGAGLQVELQGAAQDSSQYVSSVTADLPEGVIVQTIPREMRTRLYLLPVPYLDDEHTHTGSHLSVYYAMGAYEDGWRTGALERLGADALWHRAGNLSFDSPHGSLLEPLPRATQWNVFGTNEQQEIRVALIHGILESVSQAEMLEGANTAVIFQSTDQAEVVQFREAHLQEDGTYILRGLLRGRRGTDSWAIHRQADAGSSFVLISTRTTGMALQPLDALDTVQTYRGRGGNQMPEDADVAVFELLGHEYRPYAPVHLQLFAQPDGDWLLMWQRRTRLNGGLRKDTGAVPLNETSLVFEVDVYVYDTLVRTETIVTDWYEESYSFIYTSAMQAEDYAAGGATFVVYQLSDLVGRGFASAPITDMEMIQL